MKRLTCVALWSVVVVVVTGGTGWGATIVVGTFESAISADGVCSLIEAMENANDDAATHLDCVAGTGADVIEVMTGEYLVRDQHNSVFGPSGLPAVVGDLTINGHTSIIQRTADAPLFRLFTVTPGARLMLNNVTIRKGALWAQRGGGLLNVQGTVILNQCHVLANEAKDGGGLANQSGAMFLLSTTVQGNRSAHDGGGVENWADAGDASLVLGMSEVSDNLADHDGGGVSNAARGDHTGSVRLVNSFVTDNRAGRFGGGVIQFGVSTAMAEPEAARLPVSDRSPSDELTAETKRFGRSGTRVELQVIGGTVADNVAAGRGGGIATWVWPANVWTSDVELRRVQLSGNQALQGDGGGLLAWSGGTSVTVTESTFDGNLAAGGRGGGLAVGEGAVLALQRSTISNNEAAAAGSASAGAGGGVAIVDASATIILCTISGNRADSDGGGLAVATDALWSEDGAQVAVADSTIYNNEAAGLGGGVGVAGASGRGAATLRMVGSIIGMNADVRGSGNCSIRHPGALESAGHNIADDSTCWLVSSPEGADGGGSFAARDVVVADLMLDALRDNGGTTLTHMPIDGSPAIDVGSGGGMRSHIDQRGYPRMADGDLDGGCTCDTGSVEARSVPTGPRPGSNDW
jgi:hypothetical protein